ncbi:5-methylthioribose kinase [Saonia flava]|uniref:5-methylthioribose kinase n=1 Tax=Saonia flava TaxID=523696 RepID=A0A846QSB4_9FLAO|nr:phosphotransferase [Saonia flava]NJB71876.1 5-methylthioribose kinase [Saonia flava]
MILINLDTPLEELRNHLFYLGFLNSEKEEVLSVEKPGEGNMNVVLRIKTNERSFILKQSRPYVEKYKQIEAPVERIDVEHQFYESIQDDNLIGHIPKIIDYNESEHILILQDLGTCEDMTSAYETREIKIKTLLKLIQFLNIIHAKSTPKDFPKNMGLRQLNHQHIFVLPFMENNGFQLNDVQNGLQELSLPYKKDAALKREIKKIGEKYLSTGNTLLHGDFYPGSWMTEGDNIYIIDPEFSFLGFAEFDLGIMTAHLTMITMENHFLDVILQHYTHKVDSKLIKQVTGIEIMRRLIGLAQLPLNRTLQEKEMLLKMAKKLILP